MNLRNPKEYCENLLMIRTKKQALVPLRFNEAQDNLYAVIRQQAALGKPIRIIVLKGRQEGISTVTEALMFQDAATRPNVKTLIVAHNSDATRALFKMNKLFYDCLPRRMQPKVLVTPTWKIEGAVAKVEACNNGFDAVPTWEDITAMVQINRVYNFTNKTKTASKWGVNIRFTITKNEGFEGEVSISGFGGAYE